ncbi:hypothetical protein [Pseudomonas lopnurensis]|uniref:hypothetical protein n=1 Tax=Pseudomonas lopnurensis TaxID=1477517 RepID=UPI0028ADF11A|nr:hypothetical protein [Pseudomonas lopnurensis]
MSTAEFVIGYLCGLVIFFLLIWIGVALHMAYKQMDTILEHLKRSTAVTARSPLRHGGPWGEILLVGGISGIITFPGFYLKKGTINIKELENFPSRLKSNLVVLQWSAWGLLRML